MVAVSVGRAEVVRRRLTGSPGAAVDDEDEKIL